MLRVAKVRSGGHAYYLEVAGNGAGTGVEAPGRWLGTGAAALGLRGEVHGDALGAVLRGDDPLTMRRLGRSHDRVTVAGFDLSFCAPKSVSMLHALGPPEVAGEVLAAHERAVDAALDYVERRAVAVRRPAGGALVPVEAEAVAAAGFVHRVSRALDPHLHSHVVMANLGRGPEGRFSALDGRGVYAYSPAAGALYHAELRHELTVRLGVGWEPLRHGRGDIAGIGVEARRAFSQRAAAIAEHLSARRRGDPGLPSPGTPPVRRARRSVPPTTSVRCGRTGPGPWDWVPKISGPCSTGCRAVRDRAPTPPWGRGWRGNSDGAGPAPRVVTSCGCGAARSAREPPPWRWRRPPTASSGRYPPRRLTPGASSAAAWGNGATWWGAGSSPPGVGSSNGCWRRGGMQLAARVASGSWAGGAATTSDWVSANQPTTGQEGHDISKHHLPDEVESRHGKDDDPPAKIGARGRGPIVWRPGPHSRTDRVLPSPSTHYDEWWFRIGPYDNLSAERKAEWESEVARLEVAVDDLRPRGRVLELACGTGLWTVRLVRHADRIVAVDSSPEVIERNRTRTKGSQVEYVRADIFSWEPPDRYDVVFFSFWLSHVPRSRFGLFWKLVERSLAPGGRAIFIDNLWGDGTRPAGIKPSTSEQVRSDSGDGRKYQIVKIFYEPDALADELADLGWHADITTTGRSFLLGCATPNEVDRTETEWWHDEAENGEGHGEPR